MWPQMHVPLGNADELEMSSGILTQLNFHLFLFNYNDLGRSHQLYTIKAVAQSFFGQGRLPVGYRLSEIREVLWV
jgi:hypothetical protein